MNTTVNRPIRMTALSENSIVHTSELAAGGYSTCFYHYGESSDMRQFTGRASALKYHQDLVYRYWGQ